MGDDQEHSQQKSKVPNAIHDERFLPRIRRRILAKVEADQQVRSQPDAFPANKQHQEVIRQHQDRHEEHEQIEVSEKPPIPVLMRHISRGIQVNQEPNSRHHSQHDQRKVIDREPEIHMEPGNVDPPPRVDVQHQPRSGRQHFLPVVRHHQRGHQRKQQRHGCHGGTWQAAANGPVNQEAHEGEERNEPEKVWVHEG